MKWFAYSILAIFILVQFSTVAEAATDDLTSEIEVNFEPAWSDDTSIEANLMDTTTVVLEKDVMIETLGGIEGKYYGPYLQSSLFQFHHEGRYFQFSTNFTIPSTVIMNGASTFWVKVPVLPSQFDAYHVFCSWGYYDILEGQWGSLFFGGPQITWPMDSFDTVYGVTTIPDYLAGFNTGIGPGNVWSTAAGDTYQIINDPTGLYIEYKGIFHPGEEFVICFTGLLADGQYPCVYLSQERESLNDTQAFNFYDIYYLTNDTGTLIDKGYKYFQQEVLELAAAWSFIFVNGIGKEGLTSYKLNFRNEFDYLSLGHYPETSYDILDDIFPSYLPYITEYENHSYISLYIPFSADVLEPSFAGKNSVDWEITIKLLKGHNDALNTWSMYFERTAYGLADTDTVTLRVNDTEDFLLITIPYQVDFDWTINPGLPPPNKVRMKLQLTPIQDCDIVFIGADTGQSDVENGMISYRHENETASWSPDGFTARSGEWIPFEVNGHQLPLYFSLHWTDGVWAKINETSLLWVYNFGWGVGYSYPGETQIYLYLDTGGWLFYNGSYADFAGNMSNDADQETPWHTWLWEQIVNLGSKILGWVWDGITWIWETLTNIGDWIVNTITAIIGWLLSIVKDIAGKVTDIIEGMLYGMPMLVILFCATYYGEMLYKGKLPRMSKERRLYRKMIKKPAKKVYRVVKTQYKGYTSARAKSLKDAEASRNADYRQRLRQERQREKWNVGETEYRRRSESIKRSQFDTKKGVSYGKYDEKTRRGKRVKWR